MLSDPSNSIRFGRGLFNFFISLSVVQFLYIVIFTNRADVVLVLALFFLAFGFPLFTLRNYCYTPRVFNKFLIFLFFVSGVAKLGNRVDDIQTYFVAFSTLDVRNLPSAPSFLTYISVFFYPCLIAAMLSKIEGRKTYFVYLLALICLLIDLFIIGSRNIPFLIILFFVILHFDYFFSSVLRLSALTLTGACMIYAFHRSNVVRSIEAYDYAAHFQATTSMVNMPVKSFWLDYEVLHPIIFLFSYLSHSLAEVKFYFEQHPAPLLVWDPDYIFIQFGKLGLFDIEPFVTSLENENSRTDVYQTIAVSLSHDFGLLGLIAFYLWVLLLFFLIHVRQKFTMSTAFIFFLVSLSSIENYFYQGLGLGQVMIFVFLASLLRIRL